MIEGFLGSGLAAEVRGHGVDAEAGLLVDLDGVMVRGFADLLVRRPDGPLVLDYKTNRLEGTSVDELMEEKYDLQGDLYALAVSRAFGGDSVETAFVFLRDPANPVRRRYDAEELRRAEARIGGMVGDIAAGRYLGGPGAHHPPCGRCWACRLLRRRIEAAQKGTSGSGGSGSGGDESS